jgi:PAS domain S-box-containing protein
LNYGLQGKKTGPEYRLVATAIARRVSPCAQKPHYREGPAMKADKSQGGTSGLHTKPGLSAQDVADILAILPPGLASQMPVVAMGGKNAQCASTPILASADFLSLCGAMDLDGLARLVERSDSCHSEDFAAFVSRFTIDAEVSTEKLRLRIGRLTRSVAILGRRVTVARAPPLFVGIAVDVADHAGEGAALTGVSRPLVRPAEASGKNRSGAVHSRGSFFRQPGTTGSLESVELELRRLKVAFRELSAILDTATDGVAILDSQGLILSLNRSGEALFGYDQHEVQGKPLGTLLARECGPPVLEYFERLKSQDAVSLFNQGCEVTVLTRQGGTLPVFITLAQIGAAGRGTQGEARYCALLRDLTHSKNTEQELEAARKEAERANALKSAFLATVSHEIRTPLNAIIGFAEVMIEERFGPIGNPRYKDYIGDIHASGALVMSLVDDLLDLGKIEAGKMEFSFASLDVNRIVSECVSIMQPQAGREQVDIKLSLSAALPSILADERALRQIVLNLLSNAVKFNKPNGQVIVSTLLADSGSVVVRIRDTGLGMQEGNIGLAFEPFRRLTTGRPSRGTGLGLPLTKALVEANGASLTFKSKEQEGTLVEVSFPPARILAG